VQFQKEANKHHDKKIDALLQTKMDSLFARLEESAKARDETEKIRQMKLLEVMSASLLEVNETVEKAIADKLSSPEFVNTLASAINAKNAGGAGGIGLKVTTT